MRLAGAALLLLALSGVFFFYGSRHNQAAKHQPVLPTAVVPLTNSVAEAAPANTNFLAATFGPGVAELVQLIGEWRQAHPNYQMLVETTGAGVEMTAEVYRFISGEGRVVHRVKSVMREPSPLTFITEYDGEKLQAYFPEANELVQVDRAAETGRFLGQMGLTGDSLDLKAMMNLVRASFVEAGPNYQALTMMFSGAALQLPQGAGDFFLTMQLDDKGKALALEQLTLGMRVVSKLTYVDEDRARIEEKSPRIPQTAVVVKKTFREALQEQAERNKSKTGKPITI